MRIKNIIVYTILLIFISSSLSAIALQSLKTAYAEPENNQEEDNVFSKSNEEFLCWPVEGKLDPNFWYTTTVKNGDYYISSPFGYRKNPFSNTYWWHSGLDLATWSAPRDILAAESGKVIKVEIRSTGYGNNIIIEHGDKITTLYAHLSEIEVELDQNVERGEVIGKAGATGDATGVHLHFEVRINGLAHDPLPFLGMESRPPVNNYFSESIPVNAGRNIATRGTNCGAYKEDKEPLHAGEEGGKSVWFRWRPPENGIYFFKTSSNSFRSTIGVYNGNTVCSLIKLAESNDASVNPSGKFYGNPEKDYLIAVDGAEASSGLFNLIWDRAPSGSINGTVTNIDTGKGIEGVKIELESQAYEYKIETYSTNKGQYELKSVPVGINLINIIYNHEKLKSVNGISVEEDQIITKNIAIGLGEPKRLFGDVNLDSSIDVKDAILILRYIVGMDKLDEEQFLNADVNMDGEVTVLDATAILRYVVGIITELPVNP